MSRIFVYGSLRQGMYNYDIYLKDKSSFQGYAYVLGSLYTIKGVQYPALLAGDDFILGEIYEIEESVETAIDQLEQYREGDLDNEYNKVSLQIYNERYEAMDQLPVYLFNMEKEAHKELLGERIQENDYVAFMQKQKKTSNL